MSKRNRANAGFMVVAGLAGGIWLVRDFWSKGAAIAAQSGVSGLIAHATFQHKLGELLIFDPLFTAAALNEGRSWASARSWLRRTRLLCFLGGALNLSAWLNSTVLPWNDFNRLWFLALASVGFAGVPVLVRCMDGRRAGSKDGRA